MQEPKIGTSEVRENSYGKPEHKKKRIVVPGDLITAERKKLGQHVFVENGKIYSDALGIAYPDSSIAYVVPLSGIYIPRNDDLIVGIVAKETMKGYVVDINSIYPSYILLVNLRQRLKKGDVISAKVSDVNEVNEAGLFDVRVFYGGEIISVNPAKVPRMIGKAGSMLSVLKAGTGCNMLVGRNGWVWLKDGNTQLAVEAIRLIESEAHLDNLTSKVEEFLKGKKVNQ